MINNIRYISMFSGIECATVAARPLGWQPICFSEIEPFPAAVLAHHYPDVPNAGNMTTHEWSQYRGQCDVVIGGSPCQAFSVAGQRKSLDDDRGNLTLKFVEAINEIDPTFVVWENVPGVLSTADNAFGCFLGALAGCTSPVVPPRRRKWGNAGVVDGHKRSIAWRILDAQFWGVPQRRKRVFLVARRAGERPHPAEILLERGGVSRDSTESGTPRENVAGAIEASVGRSRGAGTSPAVIIPINTQIGLRHNALGERTGLGVGADGDPAYTLQQGHCHAVAIVANCITTREGSRQDPTIETLLPVYSCKTAHTKSNGLGIQENVSHAIECGGSLAVVTPNAVCYLTPLECERLQGLPDNYTLIPWRGKIAADSPRYKAIGNGMAVPCIWWVLKRIHKLEKGNS